MNQNDKLYCSHDYIYTLTVLNNSVSYHDLA